MISQVCTLETLDTNSLTLHNPAQMKVSTAFHDSYFFDGVYLTGGTPFVERVECLGVYGTLGPLAAGWGASVEMIGSVDVLTFAVPISGCRWCHTPPLV